MYCSKGWIKPEEIRDMLINSGGKEIPIPDFCRLPIKYIVNFKDQYIVIGNEFLGYSKDLKPDEKVWQMSSVEPLIRVCEGCVDNDKDKLIKANSLKAIPCSPDDWIILEVLTHIIISKHRGCIVEIGVGRSTIIFSMVSQKFRIPFYACDINDAKAHHLHLLLQDIKCERAIICCDSLEFLGWFDKNVKEKPSVVFLDGAHEYNRVMQEANFFLEKMMVGGVLFLHDTLPPSEEYTEMPPGPGLGDVYRVRQEFEKKTDDYDCFTWPYTAQGYGLTMIIKKEPNRPYYRK